MVDWEIDIYKNFKLLGLFINFMHDPRKKNYYHGELSILVFIKKGTRVTNICKSKLTETLDKMEMNVLTISTMGYYTNIFENLLHELGGNKI